MRTKVFLVGDSTCCKYDKSVRPRAGWGELLADFMDNHIEIVNEAASGRSSKSFIAEGRLDKVRKEISCGDYLFIQFGHNDEKDDPNRGTKAFTTFKSYLKEYIAVAKSKQAQPVLITPVHRRVFDKNGHLQDTHGDYSIAIKQLAIEVDVPLIDLGEMSKSLFEKLGPEQAKKLFLWLAPGQQPNYREGVQDDTHFSTYGAMMIASLVVKGIRDCQLPLAGSIKVKNNQENGGIPNDSIT